MMFNFLTPLVFLLKTNVWLIVILLPKLFRKNLLGGMVDALDLKFSSLKSIGSSPIVGSFNPLNTKSDIKSYLVLIWLFISLCPFCYEIFPYKGL